MKEEKITARDFSRLAEDRRSLYAWLSSIYISLPNAQTAKMLLDGNLNKVLTTFLQRPKFPQEMGEGVKIIDRFFKNSKGISLEELQRGLSMEFTRLFRTVKKGRGPRPPYGSVYMERGLVMGATTADVLEKYAKEGIVIREDLRGEPPDHIGLELDFLRHLCRRERDAWRMGRKSEALGFLEKERGFLFEHPARWVPTFCDEVIRWSRFGFYRGVARMTKGFVLWERNQMDILIESAQYLSRS